jgi:hypothetical protein
MNERFKQLAEQARIKDHWSMDERRYLTNYLDENKFAELIVRECMKESMDEIVSDENIAQEKDPLVREYLKGNNQGIVDAVVRFRNHFGVTE